MQGKGEGLLTIEAGRGWLAGVLSARNAPWCKPVQISQNRSNGAGASRVAPASQRSLSDTQNTAASGAARGPAPAQLPGGCLAA